MMDMKPTVLSGEKAKRVLEALFEDNGNDETNPTVAPDAEAAWLIDLLPVVQRANPFQAGSLVMLNEFGVAKYAFPKGIPLLVVETYPPKRDWQGAGKSVDLPDMDVIVRRGGEVVRFAVESWRMAFYDGPIVSGD